MNLACFEVIYKKDQVATLGAGFRGFDVTNVNQSIYREIYAFREFSRQRVWDSYDLSGLFSPRFFKKSGILRESFFSFLESTPGFDVYLFHPYPRELSISNHFLELAELEHPGLSRSLDEVWKRLFGTTFVPAVTHADSRICCHSNYFIASRRFWSEYSEFVIGFVNFMESDEGTKLRAKSPYTLSKTEDAALPLGVFAFERALTLFIKFREDRFRVANYLESGSGWLVPEIFDGEAEFIDGLLAMISRSKASDQAIKRELAVHAYYYFRKLKVACDE